MVNSERLFRVNSSEPPGPHSTDCFEQIPKIKSQIVQYQFKHQFAKIKNIHSKIPHLTNHNTDLPD